MADIIVIVIVAAAISGAVYYIYRAKKNGKGCIGCPYSKECNEKCNKR